MLEFPFGFKTPFGLVGVFLFFVFWFFLSDRSLNRLLPSIHYLLIYLFQHVVSFDTTHTSQLFSSPYYKLLTSKRESKLIRNQHWKLLKAKSAPG